MSQISKSSSIILLLSLSSLSQAEETVRVLDSKSVQSGGRTITFQRIEPPAPKPIPAPVLSAVSSKQKVGVVPWRYRRFEILSLSCTVKESGITSVRWWHKGKEYRILSSIDFNWLRGVGQFTAGEREYTMFMGIGNEMTAETKKRLNRPVSPQQTSAEFLPSILTEESVNTVSRYIVESVPESGANAEAFLGIDDLHAHFDVNREQLIALAAKNEAQQKENAACLKANPPAPKDSVIQFWPKRGSRYLNTGKGAQ